MAMEGRDGSGPWNAREPRMPEGYIDSRGYAALLGVPYQEFLHAVAIRAALEEGRRITPAIDRARAKRIAGVLADPVAVVGTVRLWREEDAAMTEAEGLL